MFDYETGIFFAFLIWLYHAIMIVITVNSRFERNLNRIGQRLSWLTLMPKPMEQEDLSRSTTSKVLRYLLVIGISLLFVLLSWLNVGIAVATIIYRRTKDSGAPQAVRELRWKLRNTELSFDQLIQESMKVADQDPSTFDEFRASVIADLEERGLRHC
ncbi:MAG: hypothetical protein CFE39_14625 [Comamonadaceae bacterium PBBC2]|nr:MAG: hypothetical protein CFE39_14625 [Comamonadaceae bacterium PBBC2]